MKKILPFTHPMVTSFPKHSYLLSGLLHQKKFIPNFFSNYIQLYSSYELSKDENWLDFYTINLEWEYNPLVYVQRVSKASINDLYTSVIDFIIKSINQGFYIIAYIDEYYIPASFAYNKERFAHPILVYGYDTELQLLEIAGFFENSKYSTSYVSFDLFISSFAHMLPQQLFYFHYFTLFKYDSDRNAEYVFDVHNVLEMLEDYHGSRNSSNRHRAFRNPLAGKYGLGVYEDIKKHLHNVLHGEPIRRQVFQLLWEHKKCMVNRILYMKENHHLQETKIILEKNMSLQNKAEIVRNLMIMYAIKQDPNIIHRMLRFIVEIAEEEEETLEVFIHKIKLEHDIPN